MPTALDATTPAARSGSWRVTTTSGTTYLLTSRDGAVSAVRTVGQTGAWLDEHVLHLDGVGHLDARGRLVPGQIRVGSPLALLLPPLARGMSAALRVSGPVVQIVEL